MSAAETWTPSPARGYKWADATPGNFIALKHGARSRRIYEPVAADLAAGLLEDRPDLEGYPDALTQWAESEARAELLRKWIAERGIFDDDESPRSGVLTWLRVFENQATDARKVLGLDPRSHAELAKVRAEATSQTFDLESLMARGREARLEGEERQAIEAEASEKATVSVQGSASTGAIGDAGLTDGESAGPSSCPRSPHPPTRASGTAERPQAP
jgi:hypothetical protein